MKLHRFALGILALALPVTALAQVTTRYTYDLGDHVVTVTDPRAAWGERTAATAPAWMGRQ